MKRLAVAHHRKHSCLIFSHHVRRHWACTEKPARFGPKFSLFLGHRPARTIRFLYRAVSPSAVSFEILIPIQLSILDEVLVLCKPDYVVTSPGENSGTTCETSNCACF